MAGASLGAAAGAILGGPIADHFGRKTLLLADAAIYAAGAILSAVTPDAGVLLFATGSCRKPKGLPVEEIVRVFERQRGLAANAADLQHPSRSN